MKIPQETRIERTYATDRESEIPETFPTGGREMENEAKENVDNDESKQEQMEPSVRERDEDKETANDPKTSIETSQKEKLDIQKISNENSPEVQKPPQIVNTDIRNPPEILKTNNEYSSEIAKPNNNNLPKVPPTNNENPPQIKTNPETLPPIISMSQASAEFYQERKWSGGLLPYLIAPLKGYNLDDMRSRLKEVGDILRERTCVRIREITKSEAKGFEDYIVMDDSPDYVTGRVGGKQQFGVLELFQGGQHRQHAAMMIMAMLGFYFEVARHDRDKYIRVHMRHIRPDKMHHFEKIREEATFNLPYDFESAMHPAWQFWRRVGKKGISTVATYKDQDPDGSLMKRLGQHEKLFSDMDIIKINSVYGRSCFNVNKKGRH